MQALSANMTYTMVKTSEKAIQIEIIKLLERNGYWAMRINSGRLYISKRLIMLARPGTPDILACSPTGHFTAIEVKQVGKHSTDIQRAVQNELKIRNAQVIEAHSADEVGATLDLEFK